MEIVLRLLLMLLVLVGAAAPARAQWRAAPLVPVHAQALPDTAERQPVPVPLALTGRTAVGVLGWAGVGAVSAYVAYNLLPSCNACEDPGLENVLLGMLVGGTAGAAWFASELDYGDGCSDRSRFVGSLAGSAAGTLLGIGLAVLVDHPLAVVAGAPVGAAAGSLLCRP
jgi:hypothetical protein